MEVYKKWLRGEWFSQQGGCLRGSNMGNGQEKKKKKAFISPPPVFRARDCFWFYSSFLRPCHSRRLVFLIKNTPASLVTHLRQGRLQLNHVLSNAAKLKIFLSHSCCYQDKEIDVDAPKSPKARTHKEFRWVRKVHTYLPEIALYPIPETNQR